MVVCVCVCFPVRVFDVGEVKSMVLPAQGPRRTQEFKVNNPLFLSSVYAY